MTLVSHAANAEDVLLWRAFGGRERGHWIDIGPDDPDVGSVTRALHDRGWTGINVIADPSRHARFGERRLDDLNLLRAVGRDPDPEADPPRETLAAIAARRAGIVPLLLHIADPAVAADVLAGADWSRDRPTLAVIAAIDTDSGRDLTAEWDTVLLDAAYRPVWFDGLKRWFVAAEHDGALRSCFDRPPNPRDDWRPASSADAELARSAAVVARLTGENGRLRARLDSTEALRVREKDGFRAELDWRLGIAETRAAELRAELAALRPHADRLDLLARELRLPDGPRALRLVLPLARALRRVLGGGTPTRPAPLSVVPADDPVDDPAPVPAPAEAQAPPAPAAPVAAPLPEGVPAIPAPVSTDALPRRAVHQYHHASADGDAISNAMLLTRDLLRAAGFASDIFVAIRDPAHAATMRLLDELPHHDDYVLIVRHSFGDPAAERIAALPAPKLFHYHNITPPSLLGAEPSLVALARLGRAQLAWWQARAVTATADSPLNALELRRHGFRAPAVATILLDPARLRARAAVAAPARRPDAPFTVLFVGRIVPSKGQAALVEAFAAFRRRFDRPSRLVLVGRGFGADAYAEQIRGLVAAHSLGEHVLFTGGVDDDTLDEWFARADVYASMSAHEGFGVPLLEAMAHGVPVVAREAGAVADTLADAGVLAPADPDGFADALAALAREPHRRDALRLRGYARLDALAPAHGFGVLLDALRLAGAAPPHERRGDDPLARRMRVTVAGHVNGSYSLAAVNRALALGLDARLPGRVALLPVEGAPHAPLDDIPPDQRAPLERLAVRRHDGAAPHVVISGHYPVWVPPAEPPNGDTPPDRAVASFFWEETLVPPATIAELDEQFDAVLAPSRFVARALRDSGLRLPIHVTGHAPRLDRLLALPPRGDDTAADRPFTFLHVSSAFPRKGVDVLLRAWALAFGAGAPPGTGPVRLVLKTFPNPHNDTVARLAAFRADHPAASPIEHVAADVDDDAMLALARDADAAVLPTRGEGFNIPAAEAIAAGLALVVSEEGGHRDFVDARDAWLVEGRHAPAVTHLAAPGSLWFEPDPTALAAALRAVAGDPGAARARAAAARAAVAGRLAPARHAAATEAALAAVLATARPLPSRRTTIVSTWGVRCGIAEYTRFLLDARPAGAGGAVTVLADIRTGAVTNDSVAIRPAWDRGDRFRPEALARAIAEADGEALLVEHQPGLFDWSGLAALLDDPRVSAAGRTVAVALHNTAHLATRPDAERDAVHAALGRADRVLVHTAADWDRLRAAGLGNVVVIPQGAPPSRAAPSRAEPPHPGGPGAGFAAVIGAFGFLLPSKGIDRLVEALPLLRVHHPGVRLRLHTAVYDDESSQLRDTLAARAVALAVADAVEWHTEFVPRPAVAEALAACDVLALPYADTLESSSAALRTALACDRPVAVTPVAIFEEAGDAVFRFGGDTPDAIASGLAALIDDADARDAVVDEARRWLAGRAWPVIARRVFGMLDGIVGERRG